MALELVIVTPEREVFSGQVDGVELPGTEGEFGVLPGHERFLAPLRIGEVEIRTARGTLYAALSEGFAEVEGKHVVVTADTCELADDIDVARAERARERAEGRIRSIREGRLEDVHLRMSELALQRAIIRIQVAGKPHISI